MTENLDLESLGRLDEGRAKLIIDEAIRSALADISDRGMDGEAREVQIKLRFVQDPSTEKIAIGVHAITKVPARRTGATMAKLKIKDGEMVAQFQGQASDSPDQMTIDEIIAQRAQKEGE